MSKCLYSGDEHTPERNEDGGFTYCAECGDILEVFDQKKHDYWFSHNKPDGEKK